MAKSSLWSKHQLTILLIRISKVMSICRSTDTMPPFDGMACQPFASRNITAIKPEFCSLACVQNQHCEATIYDKTSGVCMLMNDPCFSLEPYPNHVYRSFKYECTKWVAPDGSYPAYWFIEKTSQSYVSRLARGGNIIIGKKTNNFYSIDPIDKSVVIDKNNSYELLVVDPSCSVAWVQHDSTSGQPLPRGALIGGKLADSNTPLYVARQNLTDRVLGGYYNPLNGKVWGEYYGANNDTLFEVMVVNV